MVCIRHSFTSKMFSDLWKKVVTSISHLWLSTPWIFFLALWSVVRFCVNHSPLHKGNFSDHVWELHSVYWIRKQWKVIHYCVCYGGACMCYSNGMEVRGQFCGISSFLQPVSGFWGSNSVHQTCVLSMFTGWPSHWPSWKSFLSCIFYLMHLANSDTRWRRIFTVSDE